MAQADQFCVALGKRQMREDDTAFAQVPNFIDTYFSPVFDESLRPEFLVAVPRIRFDCPIDHYKSYIVLILD